MSVLSDIDIAKGKLELAKTLESLLHSSRDFKTVIMDYYLERYALDLLYQKSSGINTEIIDKKLEAISFFKAFIDETLTAGEVAKSDIREGYLHIQDNKEY